MSFFLHFFLFFLFLIIQSFYNARNRKKIFKKYFFFFQKNFFFTSKIFYLPLVKKLSIKIFTYKNFFYYLPIFQLKLKIFHHFLRHILISTIFNKIWTDCQQIIQQLFEVLQFYVNNFHYLSYFSKQIKKIKWFIIHKLFKSVNTILFSGKVSSTE